MRTALIILSVLAMLFGCWKDRCIWGGYSIGLAISAVFFF